MLQHIGKIDRIEKVGISDYEICKIAIFGFSQYTLNFGEFVLLARYMKFENITFYNLSVYHYNLHDKQNGIITGWVH